MQSTEQLTQVQEQQVQPRDQLVVHLKERLKESLPEVFKVADNQELVKLLRLKMKTPKRLTYISLNKQEHYKVLSIQKRNSSKRRILHNPDEQMRVLQYKILKYVLEAVPIPEYIYAFEKGKSIPDMARVHVGKKVVVSVDLTDYFHSIKQKHLEAIFLGLGFGANPARLLSELCTYAAFVPQGALTSPKISNIITAYTFGPLIKQYCEERGYALTIYADDITISSEGDISEGANSLIAYLRGAVMRYGFGLNNRKTKVMYKSQRQYVCGAVVNSKVNLQKSERHKLRAIVYNCKKNGVEAEAAKTGMAPGEFVSHITGRLNWFSQLNPSAGTNMLNNFLENQV